MMESIASSDCCTFGTHWQNFFTTYSLSMQTFESNRIKGNEEGLVLLKERFWRLGRLDLGLDLKSLGGTGQLGNCVRFV